MRKKIIIIACAIIATIAGAKIANAQTTVEIGNGTYTNSYPLPGWYGYHYSASIYNEASIKDLSGTITSIAYNFSSAVSTANAKFEVWLKDVPAGTTLASSNTFASFTSGATKVINLKALTNSSGWQTYNFDTPFTHTAGNAVLVAIRGTGCTSGGGCSRVVYHTNTTGNLFWYIVADGTDPTASATGTESTSNRPNIKFTITPAPTPPPSSGSGECEDIVIGTGVDNNSFYPGGTYGTQFQGILYKADELGEANQAKTINSLALKAVGTIYASNTLSFEIWLKAIDAASLSDCGSGNYFSNLKSGATQVLTSNSTKFKTANSWDVVTFAIPFELPANKNLLVLIKCVSSNSTGGGTRYLESTNYSPGTDIYYHYYSWQDGTANESSCSGSGTSSSSRDNHRPNIKFNVCTSSPSPSSSTCYGFDSPAADAVAMSPSQPHLEINPNPLPDGFTYIYNGSDPRGNPKVVTHGVIFNHANSTGNRLAFSAGQQYGTDTYIIFPAKYCNASQISFDSWAQGTGNAPTLEFGYVTNATTGAGFTSIGNCLMQQYSTASSTLNTFNSLPSLPAGARLALRYHATASNTTIDGFIDNICATIEPECYGFEDFTAVAYSGSDQNLPRNGWSYVFNHSLSAPALNTSTPRVIDNSAYRHANASGKIAIMHSGGSGYGDANYFVFPAKYNNAVSISFDSWLFSSTTGTIKFGTITNATTGEGWVQIGEVCKKPLHTASSSPTLNEFTDLEPLTAQQRYAIRFEGGAGSGNAACFDNICAILPPTPVLDPVEVACDISENFNDFVGATSNPTITGDLPEGYDQIFSGTTPGWESKVVNTSSFSNTGLNPTKSIVIPAGNAPTFGYTNYLVFPESYSDALGISFHAWQNNTTGTNELIFGYVTNINDAGSFVAISHFQKAPAFNTVSASESLVKNSFAIPQDMPAGARLAVKYTSSLSPGYVLIDNICLESACTPPTINLSETYNITIAGCGTGQQVLAGLTNSPGEITWTPQANSGISVSGNTITASKCGTYTLTFDQVASGDYCAAHKEITITGATNLPVPTAANQQTCHGEVGTLVYTGEVPSGSVLRWFTASVLMNNDYSCEGTTCSGTISLVSPTAITRWPGLVCNNGNNCQSQRHSSPAVITPYGPSLNPRLQNPEDVNQEAFTSFEIPLTNSNIPYETGQIVFTWTSDVFASGTGNIIRGIATQSGEYVVTCTYLPTGCSETVTIPITVSESGTGASCGLIYCDATNGDDANDGSSIAPVRTLKRALALVGADASESNMYQIRLAAGTYNLTRSLNLKSHTIIDGGWQNGEGNVWTKTYGTTKILRKNTNVEGTAAAPRLVALEGKDLQNFALQDVEVNTENAEPLTAGQSDTQPDGQLVKGAGNETNGYIGGSSKFEYMIFLYTPEMLNNASEDKIISSISFALLEISYLEPVTFDMWLKAVDFTELTHTTRFGIYKSGATQIVSGNSTILDREYAWYTINLPSNFTLPAGKSLMVLVRATTAWNGNGSHQVLCTEENIDYGSTPAPTCWVNNNSSDSGDYTVHSNNARADLPYIVLGLEGNYSEIETSVENSKFGISTYGIHLENCSEYNINRCKISAGNATAGLPGRTGGSGSNGAAGTAGQAGPVKTRNAGTGGKGGQGGANYSVEYASFRAGGKGGFGGMGAWSNGENTNKYSGFPGENGTAAITTSGTYGLPGAGAKHCSASTPWRSGTSGYPSECGSWTCGNSNVGLSGSAGSAGKAGVAATMGSITFSSYFLPSVELTSSTDGYGGGGGGGGNGGCNTMTDSNESKHACGGGAGGGGGGGEGGRGGKSGGGGGSSFGLYLVNTPISDNLLLTSIANGTAGIGGSGGKGGKGGKGGNGGTGEIGFKNTSNNATGGYGGNGGSGGKGGNGGNGADGLPGVSYKIAVVNNSGLQSSVTSGYTDYPASNIITKVDYSKSNKRGCTNMPIYITKTASLGSLPANASYAAGYNGSESETAVKFSATGIYTIAGTQIYITSTGPAVGTISGEAQFSYCEPHRYFYNGSLQNGETVIWTLYNSSNLQVDTNFETYNGTALLGYEVPTGLLDGDYTLKAAVKTNCCGMTEDAILNINISREIQGFDISIANNTVNCNSSSTLLQAQEVAGGVYSWEHDGATSQNVTVEPDVETTYRVTVTQGECSATAEKIVYVDKAAPEATIDAYPDVTVIDCINTNITLTAPAGLTYAWSGNGSGTSQSISTTSAGTYNLLVTGANGCTASSSKTLTLNRPAFIAGSISAGGAICLGESVQIASTANASGGQGTISYKWESSTDGGTSWTNIPSATAASYNPGTATQNIQYRRLAKDQYCLNDYEVSGVYNVNLNLPTEEVANGDYVWTGATNTTWATTTNWLKWNGATYVTVAVQPQAESNVLITNSNLCVSNFPNGANTNISNLTIGNNASLNLGANNLQVANMNLNANGTLNGGSGTLSVKGNFANNGTFNAGTGTVTFNGTTAQTLSGNAVSFYNFTMNNAAGLTINAEPTINNSATFTNGNVESNMTFAQNASSTSNAGSYLIGKVTKTGSGSAFTFPTGTSVLYAPLTANVSNGSTVKVAYVHDGDDGEPFFSPVTYNDATGNMDPGLHHVSQRENWSFEGNGTLSNITMSWYGGQDKHIVQDLSDPNWEAPTFSDIESSVVVAYAYYDGENSSQWKIAEGGLSHLGNINEGSISLSGSIQVTGSTERPEEVVRALVLPRLIVTFGSRKFVDGAHVILPISLLTFEGKCDGTSAELFWATASETNNEWFVVEKSADAVNFVEIGRLQGAGTTIEQQNYTYTDNYMLGGNNYYRLRQIDYDGKESVSEIISLNCNDDLDFCSPAIYAYPNPFHDDITIVIENMTEDYSIELYNELGQRISAGNLSDTRNDYRTAAHELHLSNLAPATYYVRVISANHVLMHKIVKQ